MPNDPSDAARLERTLAKTTAAALAVSRTGDDVFPELAARLAEILEVDAAMIARFDDERPGRAVTLATWFDGRLLRTFDYELAATPCRAMMDRESRFVARGVHPEFAAGTLFHAERFDSYAAHSMSDGSGRQVGLIVAMHRQPMTDRALTEALLQIFAVRAAAELERQRADAAARASEASYRAIFDAAEDAIFVHDLETGRVLDVNPKACRTYGYTHDELLRIRIADISSNVPPYTEADAVAFLDRARRGEPVRFEWHRRNKDGSLHWDEVVLKRATIGGHERILAFTRDITDRKAAHEALRLREEQYRAIFEGSADALVLWSRDVRIVDVNAAFTAMYGYTRDEIIGSTFGERLPMVDVARRIRMIQRALDGDTGQLETRTLRKSGESFDVEIRYLPILHRGEPHVLAIARDITERRRAEVALRASEAQYRSIFEAATDSLQLLDARHRVVDVNPAYERMYGKRRENVVGKGIDELVPEVYRAERVALVDRALAGEAAELQTIGFRQDGTPFDLEVRCIPFEHHGERHVLGIARDITERKRAEQALRASEARYRLLFEMESAAVVLVDAETLGLRDVNLAAVQMYGFTRDELLAMTATDLSAEPEATAPSIQEGQGALNIPLRWHRRRDGSVFPVEITANRLLLDERTTVLATIRDISVRRARDEALRASEARLRATVEAAFDCVIGMDSHGRIIEFNAAAERCFGHPRDTVIGRSLAETLMPARHRAAHSRGMASVLGGGPGRYLGRRIETEAVRADGTEFPIELAVTAAPSPDGTIFIGYLRDLTEAKRAERDRGALETQLRQAQKMEAIGQLTGGIAHDFNNILTGVMGYLALAAERPAAEADSRLQSHLEQAQLACLRARDLIQQMLAFSRGRRGEAKPVALRALVSESTRMLRATLPATVELVTRVTGDPVAKVDPVQAHQVLLNLCINARDAMQETGRIVVGAERVTLPETMCSSCRHTFSGDYAELAVADSGSGIPVEVMERMFDPFFSTKEIGQGTGMGLSIVHGAVHEHGGHVLVETRRGAGTTFRVLLPLAAATSPEQSAESDEPAPRRVALRGRVLLVEDEQSVLGFMRELLQNWGLTVVAARDPADALHWFSLEPDRFDLVLTDHTMPVMTGLELARALLAVRADVPVLLYSGRSELLNAASVAAAGVRRLLAKPVDTQALHEALREALPA